MFNPSKLWGSLHDLSLRSLWEKELLIKAGEEHIRYWTGRSEVIATRIIFSTKEQYDIDCFVFFDFENDDMKRIEKIGRTGTVSHRYNRRTV